VAHALPRLARCVSSGLWWQLVDSLWSVVESSDNWRSDAELPPEQGWTQQLLAGELPLTLAYLFPEIRPLHQLRSRAADGLTEGLVELLNGEGLPAGPYLSVLRPLGRVGLGAVLLAKTLKRDVGSVRQRSSTSGSLRKRSA